MRPVGGLPGFAAAGELIETDRGHRPQQADPGGDREEQGQQGAVGGHCRGDDPDNRIEQADEHQVAAHFAEVAQARLQCPAQILIADFPDGDFPPLGGGPGSKGFRWHDTSLFPKERRGRAPGALAGSYQISGAAG